MRNSRIGAMKLGMAEVSGKLINFRILWIQSLFAISGLPSLLSVETQIKPTLLFDDFEVSHFSWQRWWLQPRRFNRWN
jgi:hypothetical protein